eukprot:GFUD01013934.1.p1 GENE.GFUD01013934.1~~GFUD01013934.1.p1  ORF type:complete len:748 (-),score=207.67 GFUD01013934.1:40-2010(-)
MVPSMCRKFTLLPSRGFFGLFSVKRVKPEHFSRFRDCKVRNCGIWFTDKLSMFNVLRDPFIGKTYPALFIDCRNIYILSSNKFPGPVQPENHEKPAVSSALKTCSQNTQPQGVMTRSATAKLSGLITTDSSLQTAMHEKTVYTEIHDKFPSSEPADPAIVSAVATPCQPPTPCPCPLLATLLTAADRPANKAGLRLQKTVLGLGKFGYELGKIGHIPSARLVRTGYKQSWLPLNVRTEAEAELFLEDKDCYRSKEIKEAANVISNILQGKMSEVTGETLREIKMKRVEHFLKDKLGVECRLTKEGKEKLKSGEMIVDKKYGVEDVINITEVDQVLSGKKAPCINEDGMKTTKQGVDVTNENDDVPKKMKLYSSSIMEDRRPRLMKLEAERRRFEKEALIFPDKFMSGEEIAEVAPIAMEKIEISNDISLACAPHSNHISEETSKVTSDVEGLIDLSAILAMEGTLDSIKPSPDPIPDTEVVREDHPQLTPDLIGLYTLTLPVPPGSDLALLSNLQEDIAWFDTPVSILCMDMTPGGGAMLEVKLRDKEITMAVLNGLKQKYKGLEGDFTGIHADILPDKETGMYVLCFTDTHRKRYKATMEKFKMYSKQLPIISRGLGAEQVLVAFHAKEEAVKALRQNLDNVEFPELHVASVSRS